METCTTCTQSLDSNDDDTAIGCDKCPAWFHSSCTRLTNNELKALKKPSSELMWFCANCKEDSANSSTKTVVSQSTEDITAIGQKLDAILKTLQLNQTRLTVIEERISIRDEKVEALVEKSNSAEVHITELHGKVDFEVEALRNQFNDLVTAVTTTSEHARCGSCAIVSQRVETMERQNLLCNLVLDGLPSLSSNSHREDLLGIIIKLGELVRVKLQADDIIGCYRILVRRGNTVTRSPPVIIKFRHQTKRDELYFAYLQKRNLQLRDLIPEHNITSRVYLSELITVDCKLLLRRCAALKKKKLIVRYFTRSGKLYFAKLQDDLPTLATLQRVSELEEQENSK